MKVIAIKQLSYTLNRNFEYNRPAIPALKLKKGSNIQIGNPYSHGCGSPLYRCAIVLIADRGALERIGMGYWCPSCGKRYLPFKINQDALRKNHASYKFRKADLYDEQMKEFRKRERERKEKEKAKKTEEDKCTELERTDNEEKAGKESEFSGSVPYDYSTPEGSRRIGGEDFVVRKGSFACLRNSHKLDEITACITVILPKGRVQDVLVSGWYCRNCGCYCISEGDYEVLKGMGMIIARVYSEKEWITGRKVNPGMLLNDESILHRLGYNVGAADDLSDSARQDMLATMMDFKILSKRQIVDFLDMMVRLRKNIPSMENAVEKWEKDRRFASVCKLNTRQYVRVASLSIKDRIRCWDIEDT